MSRAAGVTFLVWSLLFPILIAYLNTARAHHRLRTAIEKLQQALSEVKTLRGLLPICASCRRVRESDNSWSTFERYLSAHADVDMTHGICPECVRKLYPEDADAILGPADLAPGR
jgi:hypothetical protein